MSVVQRAHKETERGLGFGVPTDGACICMRTCRGWEARKGVRLSEKREREREGDQDKDESTYASIRSLRTHVGGRQRRQHGKHKPA
jgi:hypothetical protein